MFTGLPQLEAILDKAPIKPKVAIETGTYQGATATKLATIFDTVHTIELKKELYDALDKSNPKVKYHFGDSAVLMPVITPEEPVFFYLDAHYHNFLPEGTTADSWPLWDEIFWISKRPAGDIVVVDDVHAFGSGFKRGKWHEAKPPEIAKRLDRPFNIVGDWLVVYR